MGNPRESLRDPRGSRISPYNARNTMTTPQHSLELEALLSAIARASSAHTLSASALIDLSVSLRAEGPTEELIEALARTVDRIADSDEAVLDAVLDAIEALSAVGIDPVDPEPDSDEPSIVPPGWPESAAWIFEERHPGDRGSLSERFGLGSESIVVRAANDRHGAAYALQEAAARLSGVADPSSVDVVVFLEAGEWHGFSIGTGSPHADAYVPTGVFKARSVNVIGPRPGFRQLGRETLPVGRVYPRVTVRPFKAVPGGDTIRIGGGSGSDGRPPEGATIRLIGLELLTGGRSVMNISTGAGVKLALAYCHLGIEPNAASAEVDKKWGLQLYRTSVESLRCSAHLPGMKEHVLYSHGHCAGAADQHDSLLVTSTGGQCFQYTQRRSEVEFVPNEPIRLLGCVLTGFAQNVSRAGSAVTFTGCGRDVIVDGCVILDDDPDDTPGQSESIEGTSYGGLVVWSPQDEEQSYRDLTDGYAHENVQVSNSMIAIREPNRAPAKFSDARSLTILRTAIMTAGERSRRAEINDDRSAMTPIPRYDVRPEVRDVPPIVWDTVEMMLGANPIEVGYSVAEFEASGVVFEAGATFGANVEGMQGGG